MDAKVAEAMRKYFESMLTYRVSSIISSLTALQVRLLSSKEKLTPHEMDSEIDRLERIKKLLEK